MTKEDIQKEAEELYPETDYSFLSVSDLRIAYTSGRSKSLAELEAKDKEIERLNKVIEALTVSKITNNL